MNKRLLSLTVASAMVLGLAGLATAGIPDDTLSSAVSASGAMRITPAGLGETLAGKGLTVTATVLDATSAPIAGYAFQDMYLDDNATGEISLCQGGSVADGNTNALGVATFSGAISGGGWTLSGLRVYLAGTPIQGLLAIDLVSPDQNGDLKVDLIDVGSFSGDFAGGVYVFRSDIVPDGLINVADIGKFAESLGEVCP